MSTHNLCFRAKIRKNVYSCKSQFYYIKVGCKGVYITGTCYADVLFFGHWQTIQAQIRYQGLHCSLIGYFQNSIEMKK